MSMGMPELGWDINHPLHLALVVHVSYCTRPAESAPQPRSAKTCCAPHRFGDAKLPGG